MIERQREEQKDRVEGKIERWMEAELQKARRNLDLL